MLHDTRMTPVFYYILVVTRCWCMRYVHSTWFGPLVQLDQTCSPASRSSRSTSSSLSETGHDWDLTSAIVTVTGWYLRLYGFVSQRMDRSDHFDEETQSSWYGQSLWWCRRSHHYTIYAFQVIKLNIGSLYILIRPWSHTFNAGLLIVCNTFLHTI